MPLKAGTRIRCGCAVFQPCGLWHCWGCDTRGQTSCVTGDVCGTPWRAELSCPRQHERQQLGRSRMIPVDVAPGCWCKVPRGLCRPWQRRDQQELRAQVFGDLGEVLQPG